MVRSLDMTDTVYSGIAKGRLDVATTVASDSYFVFGDEICNTLPLVRNTEAFLDIYSRMTMNYF